MIDYVLLLENNYPTANFSGSCADYNKIDWKDTIIPKPTEAELLVEWDILNVSIIAEDKISELSMAAGQLIEKGFWSSALGKPYYYDAKLEDQMNLIGVVAAGTDTYYPCRDSAGAKLKSYHLHTISQLHTVIEDGKNYKLFIFQKFNTLKNDVLACTDITQINLIKWVL